MQVLRRHALRAFREKRPGGGRTKRRQFERNGRIGDLYPNAPGRANRARLQAPNLSGTRNVPYQGRGGKPFQRELVVARLSPWRTEMQRIPGSPEPLRVKYPQPVHGGQRHARRASQKAHRKVHGVVRRPLAFERGDAGHGHRVHLFIKRHRCRRPQRTQVCAVRFETHRVRGVGANGCAHPVPHDAVCAPGQRKVLDEHARRAAAHRGAHPGMSRSVHFAPHKFVEIHHVPPFRLGNRREIPLRGEGFHDGPGGVFLQYLDEIIIFVGKRMHVMRPLPAFVRPAVRPFSVENHRVARVETPVPAARAVGRLLHEVRDPGRRIERRRGRAAIAVNRDAVRVDGVRRGEVRQRGQKIPVNAIQSRLVHGNLVDDAVRQHAFRHGKVRVVVSTGCSEAGVQALSAARICIADGDARLPIPPHGAPLVRKQAHVQVNQGASAAHAQSVQPRHGAARLLRRQRIPGGKVQFVVGGGQQGNRRRGPGRQFQRFRNHRKPERQSAARSDRKGFEGQRVGKGLHRGGPIHRDLHHHAFRRRRHRADVHLLRRGRMGPNATQQNRQERKPNVHNIALSSPNRLRGAEKHTVTKKEKATVKDKGEKQPGFVTVAGR